MRFSIHVYTRIVKEADGDGGMTYTSPTGVTWSARTNPNTGSLVSIVHTGRQWVAVANSSTFPVASSIDGVTWKARLVLPMMAPSSQPLWVTKAASALVPVGFNQTLCTSLVSPIT